MLSQCYIYAISMLCYGSMLYLWCANAIYPSESGLMIYNLMILPVVVSIFLLLVASLLSFVLFRYLKYQRYSKALSKSYKSLILPFDIGGDVIFGFTFRQAITHKDAHYSVKNVFPHYQVIFGTLLTKPIVILIEPTLIKEFYQKANEGFYEKEKALGPDYELYSLLGGGLVFSQGEKWKAQRKLMSHAFNFDFIRDKLASIAQITQQKIRDMEQTHRGNNINLSLLLQQIFGTVVVKCFFGDMKLALIDGMELFTFFDALINLAGQRARSPYTLLGDRFFNLGMRAIDRDICRRKALFRQYVLDLILTKEKEIKASKKDQEGEKVKHLGLLDLLIGQGKIKEKGSKTETFYTHQQFVDELSTFFFAGTDTVSNSTLSLLYLLSKHPQVQAKVRKELQQVFNGNIQQMNFQNVKKLKYLQCVQKQVLRMYSPGMCLFLRVASKDHMLGNIAIEKGDLIQVMIAANQFKEEYYQDPHCFKPERWEKERGNEWAFYPFSMGQRACIGQQLSYLESKIVIATLLTKYEKIELEKPDFVFKYQGIVYAPEAMNVNLVKKQ